MGGIQLQICDNSLHVLQPDAGFMHQLRTTQFTMSARIKLEAIWPYHEHTGFMRVVQQKLHGCYLDWHFMVFMIR